MIKVISRMFGERSGSGGVSTVRGIAIFFFRNVLHRQVLVLRRGRIRALQTWMDWYEIFWRCTRDEL
jgi:hypothetical protein